MKKLIVDLDGTITIDNKEKEYFEKDVNIPLVKKLNDYKKNGFFITIFTARNMNTFKGDKKKIIKYTLPAIKKWLSENNVPYDEIIIGKPWCGFDGFYIDDKSIRPDEFINLSHEEIINII
jgi:capsule biosynthesis phosphatase